MGKRLPSAVRLDIIGLDPRIFALCKQNKLSIIEQRSKGRTVSSTSQPDLDQADYPSDISSLPKGQQETYNRIVSVAIDFERAYGRNSSIRIFERSQNKFLNFLLLGRRRSASSQSASIGEPIKPVFNVNGIRVFVGVPNSFSELDEAIDNAFGRRFGSRKDYV